MALVGNLKDLKLPNLIQLNCMEKNTAKLTVEHAGKFGTIYFQAGQIVHSEYDPDIGEKAIHRLLALTEGKFKVESGVRPPAITIETSWSNLLLEGLHQIDTRQLAEDGKNRELLEMLMNVKGVLRSAVISKDGEMITGNFAAPDEFALSAFTVLEIGLLSDAVNLTYPDFINMIVNQNRILLKKQADEVFYIELAVKFQLDTVLPFIKKILNG